VIIKVTLANGKIKKGDLKWPKGVLQQNINIGVHFWQD
jgi:hypothetical protein